jgi:phage host-nuclease inhibitor protein Gam
VSNSYDEVNTELKSLGDLRRELAAIELVMNEHLAEVKADFEARAEGAKSKAVLCEKLVREYCKAHRKELTKDGAVKYHKFPAGTVTWRKAPPSISVGKRAVDAVLAYLHSHKLGRFIRTHEKLDKEAMLAEPDTAASIPGLKLRTGGEQFVITPLEVPLSDSNPEATK